MTHREIKIMLKTIAWMFCIAALVWFGWSYVDVIAYQNCGGTQNPLNLFNLMFGMVS